MSEQLQPIFDALKTSYGWGPAVIAWCSGIMFLFRFLKPINLRLQAAMTNVLVNASAEKDEAMWWHDQVLTRWWYRAVSFLVDFMLTIKLPTHADFHRMMQERVADRNVPNRGEPIPDRKGPDPKPTGPGDPAT